MSQLPLYTLLAVCVVCTIGSIVCALRTWRNP
jgi:hypothetical protein